MTIILGSSSPRRVEIFQALQIPFTQAESPADESAITQHQFPDLREMCRQKAVLKAQALKSAHPDATIIGADTIVIFNGKLHEKPRDAEEAASFMRSFSGNTITAVSAVCVLKGDYQAVESDDCDVTMAQMSEEDVKWYVASGDWKGKAGGFGVYAVAGRFIQRVSGDYFVAVGLPVFKMCRILTYLGDM